MVFVKYFQGCALRKISGSPSASQAFYSRSPDLKGGRLNKNFGEPFGIPSIPAWVPRPLSTSDEEVYCMHTNLTGLLITKIGNFLLLRSTESRMLSYETHQIFGAIQT